MTESNSTGSVLFRDVSLEPSAAKEEAVRQADLAPSSAAPSITEHRSSGMLWTALVALALALLALGSYDYWFVNKNGMSIAQLPAVISSVGSMTGRLDSIESQLKDWTSDRQALLARMAKTDAQVRASLGAVRAETRRSIAAAEKQFDQKLEAQTAPLAARLSQVEAQQQSDQANLAQLKSTVGDLRQQAAAAAAESSENARALANQPAQTQAAVNTATEPPARSRVRFELRKGIPMEVAPGVSLRITKTNVNQQSFSGWIRFLSDGQILAIKNQDAERPVTFYSPEGAGPYDLIVNMVNKHVVGGYILMPPPGPGETQSSETGQATPGAPSNPGS